MNGGSDEKWALWISVGVTAVAAVAVAAHLVWPNLKIDYVTVLLLAIASLPWLRGIVSSVDLPGGASIKLAARQRVIAQDRQEIIEAVRSRRQPEPGFQPTRNLASTVAPPRWCAARSPRARWCRWFLPAPRWEMSGMTEIRVGTAGWTDKTLIESGWYPDDASNPERRLRYYASQRTACGPGSAPGSPGARR